MYYFEKENDIKNETSSIYVKYLKLKTNTNFIIEFD